jgi:predicted DCC family thiol-disulfide oxidoreductase YuxK
MVTAMLVISALAAGFFILGKYDRTAAIVMWYVLACTFGRNPLIGNPSLPYVGWLLLAHVFLPAAPYGSVAAVGRVDPRGAWRMPHGIFAAAWIAMSVGYTYSGYTKLVSPSWIDGTAMARVLANPLARPTFIRDAMLALPPEILVAATWSALLLELLFAPLALVRRVRPWIWLAMLGMHLGLMVVIDFADLSFGMVLLHVFTFDPGWIAARFPARRDRILYDGSCGLCHHAVRFVLAEDRQEAFVFAPLPEQAPQTSVIVETAEGQRLERSAAVRYGLARLGGIWRLLAIASGALPRALLDKAYDAVARVRRALFRQPDEACPVLPPDLRSRFESH